MPFRRARTFAAAPKRTANLAALNERLSPEASVPSKRTTPLAVSRRTESQVSIVAVTWSRASEPVSGGAAAVVVGVVVGVGVVAFGLVGWSDVDVTGTVLAGAVVDAADTAPSDE